MAEAWASHILNHLLCFLWWIKNEYLDKTINWKSAKKQFLIQEYLRLLYSFTGLGEFGSLYQDYTLTSLFFCIQNLMLPYPGLSGSAFDYQDQWTEWWEEKLWGNKANPKWDEAPVSTPVSTCIYSGFQQTSFGKDRFTAWALAQCFRQGGDLGQETTV